MNEKDLERPLKALANRRRLAILRYLKKNKEASVGEIAGAIRLSFKSTSRHLAILAGSDILDREQRNLQIFYFISPVQSLAARNILSIL